MQRSVGGFEDLTVRLSGDSGDGIQLAGEQLALAATIDGNEVMTLADFPSEIRPPEGTLSGVSSFQLRIGSKRVFTPGDKVDIMVAFNPAALKTNLEFLNKNGIVIVNEDAFTPPNLLKAEFKGNPLDDGSLSPYVCIRVPLSRLTKDLLRDSGLSRKEIDRSKNFFALGIVSWTIQKSTQPIVQWINRKFANQPQLREANLRCLEAGFRYGENGELPELGCGFHEPARTALDRGTVGSFISGNAAMALGLHEVTRQAGIKLLMAGYPITPATSIYENVAAVENERVEMFQAEDEIAAIGAAVGASYAGALGVTCTSGPGLSLMLEFMGLAVMAELPLLIIDVQRAGPSTGLPTKSEQSDLFQACYGRHGESPVIVMAAGSPADGYSTVLEAAKLAIRYMTPVIVLSDAFLSNSAESLDRSGAQEVIAPVSFCTDSTGFMPYGREQKTLARPWVALGTPGLESVTGGLEKENLTGSFSQNAENHEVMVKLRAEKVLRSAQDFSPLDFYGPARGELLLVGWGSTFGALREATMSVQKENRLVSHLHLKHLHPFPLELGELLKSFKRVVVVENNLGQLWTKLRAEYLVPAGKLNSVQGRPFKVAEIYQCILQNSGGGHGVQ